MTPPVVLALLGFGLGALVVANRRVDLRAEPTLRERAIEAQKISACASQLARDLTARWCAEEARRRETSQTRIL